MGVERDIWGATKALFEAVKLQQAQLESLQRTLSHLSVGIGLVVKAATGEDDASPSGRVDVEAARRAQAEIRELEKLFGEGV